MEKILGLRYEGANLLGYKNPADFILELKMAKKTNVAMNFLKDLEAKVRKGAKSDLKAILDKKKEVTRDKKAKLYLHDISFYSRLLKEEIIGLDKEEVKKHFQFNKVKDGVFEVYSKLLGISFKKEKGRGWHEDVDLYSVRDGKAKVLAHFFMDVFPREGKYGHAAAFSIVEGRKQETRYVQPVSALVMNIPRPQKDQPSLLSHGEVTTFFHEFGHIMHQCLTTAPYMSQSGTSVARDFVEAPSQIFENWGWQRSVLGKISEHFEKKTVMPAEMINKLIGSKNFLEPYFIARQLALGLFDMSIHSEPGVSINETFKRYWRKLIGIDLPKNSNYPAGFGHFVGYQAGYYGYLWSAVYAADMFSVFDKNGIFNKRIGAKYRREILSQGSSREEMVSLTAFLGRRPNNKAFLEEIGLQ
jgi:thimet oligopeptidase